MLSVCTNVDTNNFLDIYSSFALSQVNNVTNFMNRILDLIFCSSPDDIALSKSEFPLSKIDKFYVPLEFLVQIHINPDAHVNKTMSFYDFQNADYVSLNSYLSNIKWERLFVASDVDTALTYFYEIIDIGFVLYVPLKSKRLSVCHPKWYDKELTHLKNMKNKAHKKYRESGL